jgi:AraC-like DNA-binding protein
VENHYGEKISIHDIAQIAGFSDSHFMRYFKETMGTSFVDYLKEYRLTMAARLLLSSDSSILAIASEVGFDNLSYFNRSFKKQYKVTPSQYRRG